MAEGRKLCESNKNCHFVEPTEAPCMLPGLSSLLGPTLIDASENSHHICWLTGGLFLPDKLYEDMYLKGKNL